MVRGHLCARACLVHGFVDRVWQDSSNPTIVYSPRLLLVQQFSHAVPNPDSSFPGFRRETFRGRGKPTAGKESQVAAPIRPRCHGGRPQAPKCSMVYSNYYTLTQV